MIQECLNKGVLWIHKKTQRQVTIDKVTVEEDNARVYLDLFESQPEVSVELEEFIKEFIPYNFQIVRTEDLRISEEGETVNVSFVFYTQNTVHYNLTDSPDVVVKTTVNKFLKDFPYLISRGN